MVSVSLKTRINGSPLGALRPNQTPPAYRRAVIAAVLANIPVALEPSARLRPANTSATPAAKRSDEAACLARCMCGAHHTATRLGVQLFLNVLVRQCSCCPRRETCERR